MQCGNRALLKKNVHLTILRLIGSFAEEIARLCKIVNGHACK